MVAEHTWGVDIKSYLRDTEVWSASELAVARRSDYRFIFAEQSWVEQRTYLSMAVSELDRDDRVLAAARLNALDPAPPALPGPGSKLEHGGWRAEIDPASGDLINLSGPNGQTLTGEAGSLIGYRHESYDWAELQKHLDTYLQHRDEWAILDHDKPGLENAAAAQTATIAPNFAGVAQPATSVATMPAGAHHLGAPARIEFSIESLGRAEVALSLILRDKPANRMPEAGFLHVTPQGSSSWELQKMGLWHRSEAIARRGGGQLQGVQAVQSARSQSNCSMPRWSVPPAALHALPAGVAGFLQGHPDQSLQQQVGHELPCGGKVP